MLLSRAFNLECLKVIVDFVSKALVNLMLSNIDNFMCKFLHECSCIHEHDVKNSMCNRIKKLSMDDP